MAADRVARCHPHLAIYARGMCRSCYEKDLRSRKPDFADRQRANARKWAKANKEQKLELDHTYRHDPRNKDRRSLSARRRTLAEFGLTLEDEERILQEQGYRCAICEGPSGGRWFHCDHDHQTGEFRGFLCGKCNKGLGLLGDNVDGLRKALAYLEGRTR